MPGQARPERIICHASRAFLLSIIIPVTGLALSPAALGQTRPEPPVWENQGGGGGDSHAHFDFLANDPLGYETQIAVSLRSQEEVDRYFHGQPSDLGGIDPHYDPVEDAEIWPMENGRRSYFVGQARIPVATSTPARSLFYWETKWDVSWTQEDAWTDGSANHKAFQLRKGSNTTWTINSRYGWHTPYSSPDGIAKTSWSLRSPWSSAVDSDNQEPPTAFVTRAGVWTRFWYWVDMANDRVAVWMADEDRPTPRFLGVTSDLRFDGDRSVSEFLFEWNSSQSGDRKSVV